MPLEPGSPEWYQRVEELRRQESAQPYRWWYLSFANDGDPRSTHGGFLGACLVRARGFTLAVELANALGINPGDCEVRGNCLNPNHEPPAELTGRLLTYEEMERELGEMERW